MTSPCSFPPIFAQLWERRPMPEQLIEYAVGDIAQLFQLYDAMNEDMDPE